MATKMAKNIIFVGMRSRGYPFRSFRMSSTWSSCDSCQFAILEGCCNGAILQTHILLVASRTLEPMFYPNGSSHWVLPKFGMGSDPSNCQQKRCLLSLNKGLYEYL